MTQTNDEVKEKIKEILHARMMAKSDYDTYESRLENTTKSLVTLYTEMVEGEKKESYKEGALWAYKMFLKAIKDAKNKFPNSKEFEIVADVRDIEKSIQYLLEKSTKGNDKKFYYHVEGSEKAV